MSKLNDIIDELVSDGQTQLDQLDFEVARELTGVYINEIYAKPQDVHEPIVEAVTSEMCRQLYFAMANNNTDDAVKEFGENMVCELINYCRSAIQNLMDEASAPTGDDNEEHRHGS